MKIRYFYLIVLVLLAGCAAESENSGKLNVIVSILPQKAFVEAVGGEHVNVKVLIPPGGSPATYDLKPSDLVAVEGASIYFRIGYIPFELSNAQKIANLNPSLKIIDTSVNVSLRHSSDSIDPHIWLSPIQVKHQVDTISSSLCDADPENCEDYLESSQEFKHKLDELHAELNTEFSHLKTKKLMVFHPAWGYFADEFGLQQIAIEEDGKEPTAMQLQHLIDKARSENIKVIFVQSQFNQNIANSVAEQLGAIVISIDPLAEDYLNNLRSVASSIASHLK